MGKKPFLAAFVIAVLAFLFAPAACEAIFGSVELYWNSIEPFFLQMSAALGYASGGAYPINPSIFFTVVTALGARAAYLLTRRADVR